MGCPSSLQPSNLCSPGEEGSFLAEHKPWLPVTVLLCSADPKYSKVLSTPQQTNSSTI